MGSAIKKLPVRLKHLYGEGVWKTAGKIEQKFKKKKGVEKGVERGVEKGLLKRIGPAKGGHWEVKKNAE